MEYAVRRVAVGLAAFMLVIVCATPAEAQASRDAGAEQGAREGVVVFSVAHDAAGGAGNNVLIYLNGGPLGRNGAIYESSEKVLGTIPRRSEYKDVRGRLFAVPLPPGEHEFTNWNITNGSGLRIFPKGMPTQRFQVNAGQVKYLGRFHGHLARGKNLFGITVTGDGFVSVNDEQATDLELLGRRFPQYSAKVEVDLLRAGPWAAPQGVQVGAEQPASSASAAEAK